MTIKIDKKITNYEVVTKTEPSPSETPPAVVQAPVKPVRQFGEPLSRPEKLVGNTYKVKTPATDHALYITINDMVMEEGTPGEHRRPFEIFINSKNMEHFQWIVALTRVMSAVFRQGGDVTFLLEELGSVFDPKGGYFKKGGRYIPSIVADIGEVLKEHLQEIGMLDQPEQDANQKAFLEAKRMEYVEKQAAKNEGETSDGGFPPGSSLCPKCNTKAVIKMDGCLTCLNCGDSKCG
jgi:hypothetical protein